MAGLGTDGVVLAILIGVLAAVVYSIRMIIVMDKKIDVLLGHRGHGNR